MPDRIQSPGDPPVNDNESPDESWRRADLILQAYSGADLDVVENQKLAVTQLLTDLMHYCDTMSTGVAKNNPDFIDFDKLLQAAKGDFKAQDLTMKSVMDATVERHASYVAKKISEFKNEGKQIDGQSLHPPDPSKYDYAPRVPEKMYRDPNKEPAYMADQVAEHNRVLASFEGEKGNGLAQDAYQFWRDEFDRDPSPHANRMRDIAGGIVGFYEPWMTKVGYLTESDRHGIAEFRDLPHPAVDKPYIIPDLGKLNRDISTRQSTEAAELSTQQELQTHGDLTPSHQNLSAKQRDELDAKFAEERERYNGEYQDAQRISEEIRETEKQEGLEHGEEEGKGFSR